MSPTPRQAGRSALGEKTTAGAAGGHPRRRLVTRAVVTALSAVTGLSLAACGGGTSNPLTSGAKGSVVVGSANFPENQLIATIYAQALRGAGVKVTDKFNIGAREVYYPEVEKGVISIIPEYNGALLTTSVDPKSTAATKTQVNAALRAKLPKPVLLLRSSLAEDKDSVTVTQAFAKAHHLTSIAQLTPVAKQMVFGGPPEFKTRADGLPGLTKHYGLTFKSFAPLDESGPLTLKALTTGKVQAADVFTTTPQIITDHLVSLADPKADFAAQNVTPLVYKKAMTRTIEITLDQVDAHLTTAGLLALDKQVILDKANYTTVAAAWLKKEGIK